VIIEKHWRGVVTRQVVEYFWENVKVAASPDEVAPIIPTAKDFIFHIYRKGMFLLCVVKSEGVCVSA
jgi:AP-3 complex subunit mu